MATRTFETTSPAKPDELTESNISEVDNDYDHNNNSCLSPIDGGVKAWSVVAGAWCCLFCGFGWVNAAGVFQEYYQEHQLKYYSPSSISWIMSLQPFVLFSAGLIIGKVFDNHGPRWLLLTGTILCVLGLIATSFSTEFYQFALAQGICTPLGASCVFYPALSCTATWFQDRRALAFGIVSSGSSLGGVIFPIVLSKLLSRIGFSWTVRVCSLVLLFMLVVANLTVRSRIKPIPRPATLNDYIGPFSELPYVLLTLAASSGFFAMFVPLNYLILQAQANSINANLASSLLTILNAFSLPGRIIPGYYGDKIGRFNTMLIMCILSALSILVLWLPGTLLAPRSTEVYIVFAIFYGFASGAFVGMVPALIGQISPDVSKIGMRQGVLFTCLSFATLTGSPIAGAILNSQHGSYWGLQVFAGGMMTAAIIFFGACRVVLSGFNLMSKV